MASGPVTLDMQIAEDPRIGIVCVLRLNSTASLVIIQAKMMFNPERIQRFDKDLSPTQEGGVYVLARDYDRLLAMWERECTEDYNPIVPLMISDGQLVPVGSFNARKRASH